MTPEQWQRVKELFDQLCELEPTRWSGPLAAETDPVVAKELHRLLQAHQAADHGLPDLPSSLRNPEDLLIGQRLGPFLIERLIGEGGNGRVYLAERQDLGGRAAVKLLRGRFMGPDITRRFHAEQAILARLDHPNIAHLLQVGVAEDGTPWLAMEYVEGQPFLQGLAAMSVRQRLRVILKLLDAVDYAHGQLVVHRDIKPGNILIDQRGEPRLLDFGIAKRLDDAGAQLTHTDSHPRTPAYAAPEQVRGEPISVATDVYALGVLLFESLTGSKPWNLAGMQLDAAILKGTPPLPSALCPPALQRELRGDLDAIILQAMHLEPHRRYRGARLLAEDLIRYLDHRPVAAQKQTAVYRASRYLRRNYRWLAAASLVAIALSLGVFRESRLRQEARLEAQKSDQVAAFMLDMFDAGDSLATDFAISKNSTVMDLMARADARLDQLDSAPLVRADLAHKMGQVYWGLSEYAGAERLFAMALALRKQFLGAHDDTAESYLMLGRVYGRTGRYREMLEAMQQSYAMRLKTLGPDSPNTIHSLHRIGTAYYFLNQLDQAESYFNQAVAAWRLQTPQSNRQLANALTMLASVEADRGEFERALPVFEEVLALFRESYPPEHPFISEGLHNLSTCLFDMGRVAEAIQMHRQAIEIDEAAFDGDDRSLVIDYEWMARYQVAAGDLAEAAAMADQAVAMASRLHQQSANQELLDRARQMQVEVLRAQGQLETALELQRDVLSTRLQRLPATHIFVIGSRSVLADLLLQQGRIGEAAEQLNLALEGWRVQPSGYVRQLVHTMNAFASAGNCAWLAGAWPAQSSAPMRAAVERGRQSCVPQT
ncbi:MAG: serine/threonine protein kinase [Rhodanobacteraceae bacterium]|nr:serine/threonine protein kinase [Rhodanobacteraceae bacterium]